MAGPNGLSSDQYERYRNAIGARESGNRYDATEANRGNYLGRYQLGAAALEDGGYLKPGAFKREGAAAVNNPANWTGKNGVTSKQSYLGNPQAQDTAFNDYTARNEKALERMGVITPNSTPEERGGYLAAAHLTGPGGAKALKDGKVGKDANGTPNSQYYGIGASAVNGSGGVGSSKPPKPGGTKPQPQPSKPSGATDDAEGTDIQLSDKVISRGSVPSAPPGALPLDNKLWKFASFNYNWTICCIPIQNFNDGSYKTMSIDQNIVLASGGRNPEGHVQTEFGKFNYFIDNMIIESLITPSEAGGSANANKIRFTVYEPTSLGLFPQSLVLAAEQAGYKLFSEAPYLLALDFRGWDTDGNPIDADPETSRRIPIKINKITAVSGITGTTYDCSALLYNERVFSDEYNKLNVDLNIQGKTVEEALQRGQDSLQVLVNLRLEQMRREGKFEQPDEIVVAFPKEMTEQLILNRVELKETEKRALFSDSVGRYLGGGGGTKNPEQTDGDINEIGHSDLEIVMKTGGARLPNDEDEVRDKDTQGTPIPREQNPDSKRAIMQFDQSGSIQNIIEKVILRSKWAKDFRSRLDSNGYYDWFRIEPEIQLQPVLNSKTNRLAKQLIYRVVPYKVHSSRFAVIGSKMIGKDSLLQEAAKIYDYIYSGKNLDVIDFKLDFNYAFSPPRYLQDDAEYSGKGTDLASQGINKGDTVEPDPFISANPNQPAKEVSEAASNNYSSEPTPMHKKQGGGIAEDPKRIVAQKFYEAVLNGLDLTKLDLEILGDPYFLADSGMGNYRETQKYLQVLSDDTMAYQYNSVYIRVNFRLALDYDENSGIMRFIDDAGIIKSFSGLYQVNKVEHRFQGGKFTQKLSGIRPRGQSDDAEDNTGALPQYNDADEPPWWASVLWT